MLLVLGIALAVSLLIILSYVGSSIAQSYDDSGWWDARDYYNQFVNFKDSYNYVYLFLILFFVIIVGVIVIWELTHRTKKERRYSLQK